MSNITENTVAKFLSCSSCPCKLPLSCNVDFN